MFRSVLLRSTAIAVALSTGHFTQVSAQIAAEYQDLPLALRPDQGNSGAAGSFEGFSWSLNGTAKEDGSASLDDGAALGLGFDSASISLRGKWDSRYQARGGLSMGALLDDAGQNALGAGVLANDEVLEFYGQYLTVLPEIDPSSSFTLGGYVSREEQSFNAGKADVWGYTGYLNWFKRGRAGQVLGYDLPPGLRSPIDTLMNSLSSLSGTAAFTHAPKVRRGSQGTPKTNALDLSMRAVSPALLGPYFPISMGGGLNFAHYDQIDNSRDFRTVATGGAGIAFEGARYFGHSWRWLVGFGVDMDTDGTVGGTLGGEVESFSLSYRQTSTQDKTLLVSWRVSDLWTGAAGTSAMGGFDTSSPASFRATQDRSTAREGFQAAERNLARLGFLPPTGPEVGPLPGSGPSGTTTNVLQFSPALASQQPLEVQRAILRTQELQKDVQDQKNREVSTGGSTKAVIAGLTLSGSVSYANGEVWATFTSIQNAASSSFTVACDPADPGTPTVSVSGSQIIVNLGPGTNVTGGCDAIIVYQDGVSLGSVPTFCFIAGTLVVMEDGSAKKIEDILAGDRVRGADGAVNTVVELHRPKLGQQHLYAINGSRFFVSDGHPFMTSQGWKAMDPVMAKQANPALEIGRLEVGDLMITETGETRVERIEKQSAPAETQLYNFSVTGNRTYYVRENGTGYLVHNK